MIHQYYYCETQQLPKQPYSPTIVLRPSSLYRPKAGLQDITSTDQLETISSQNKALLVLFHDPFTPAYVEYRPTFWGSASEATNLGAKFGLVNCAQQQGEVVYRSFELFFPRNPFQFTLGQNYFCFNFLSQKSNITLFTLQTHYIYSYNMSSLYFHKVSTIHQPTDICRREKISGSVVLKLYQGGLLYSDVPALPTPSQLSDHLKSILAVKTEL